MNRARLFQTVSALTVCIAANIWGGSALAQGSSNASEISEVVVTGSYIAGTPEDAALPVDVISAEELSKRGAPSVLEIVKTLPATNATFGDANQFSGAPAGTANINLRGLGATRTLVLWNGHRLPTSPSDAVGVDINLLPQAAIGRIEVLKDGAAATYGSDAIGGVVNFISKKTLDGLQVDANYSYIKGSDGEYGVNLGYGWVGEVGNLLVTAGYRHRSELDSTERSWANRPFAQNPEGLWSSGGNPGSFSIGSASTATTLTTSGTFVDPNCSVLGGTPTATVGGITTPVSQALAINCRNAVAPFENLIEQQDDWQLYAESNVRLTDDVKLHVEAMYGKHTAPEENISPSYLPNNYPSRAVSGKATAAGAQLPGFYVPCSGTLAAPGPCNPGLQALIAQNPTASWAANAQANGVLAGSGWRPFALGGNPNTGYGSTTRRSEFEGWRVGGGLTGSFPVFGGINWDASTYYGRQKWSYRSRDLISSRMSLALRGLGGPSCITAPGYLDANGQLTAAATAAGVAPGVGNCKWFYPTSTSIPGNPITGARNPNFVGSTENNNLDLNDWLIPVIGYDVETEMFVSDIVLNGKLGFALPGGDIAWAAGVEYLNEGSSRNTLGFYSGDAFPCVDTPVTGSKNCAVETGPLGFGPNLLDTDLSRSSYSIFGEINFPILDTLEANFAIRRSDYGENGGDTTNPKLSIRWQATPILAFRGSAGTTFRAPPQANLTPGATSTPQFIALAGAYKAVLRFGNPNLTPESADTLSVGAILEVGGFNATVDYWKFHFKDPFGLENPNQILGALFPAGQPNHCDGANGYANLLARVDFGGLPCSPLNTNRITINYINLPAIDTSGIDVSAGYRLDDVWGGTARFGVDFTYKLKYEIGDRDIEGILVEAKRDYVGLYQYGGVFSQPRIKGAAYAEWGNEVHNLRWTVNVTDGMTDTRGPATFTSVARDGQKIKAFVTSDLAYRATLPWDTTVSLAVLNVLDKDPPFARIDLSYDPFTASSYGRVIKASVSKKF